MVNEKSFLLFVFPGPIYEPEISLGGRLRLLSEHYEGVVVTTSSLSACSRLGGFEVISFKFFYKFRFFNDLLIFFGCLRQICRSRQANRPIDLIVTYDPLKTGLIGWMVAKIANAKLIVEVNGVYQSPYLFSGQLSLRNKIRRQIMVALERFVLARADGVKLLFPEQVNEFREELAKHKPIISCYFDYVDIERFHPEVGKKCILFVGFPFYLKGVDLLLSAFSRIYTEFPGWRLKLLGWFSESEREIINKISKGIPQIEYHPPVPYSEMPDHIAHCACLVLPSRTEAMGRVLIEAMACGKPRIGANVDGIPTVINHGLDGFLFEPGSVDDLADKLRSIMGDQSLRDELGENAFLRGRQEFSGAQYLRHTMKFYGEVLKVNG